MAGLSDLDGSIIEDSPEEMTFQLKSEQQVNYVKGGWGTEEQDFGGYLSSLFQVLKPGTI